MNIDQCYPSKYIKAADLPDGKDMTLTIARITVEELGDDEKESKPIVYFERAQKGLVCNKTNARTISKLYGAETDNWIGKRITLGVSWVDFAGDQVLALRVRPVMPAPKQASSNGQHVDTREPAPARSNTNGRQYDGRRPADRQPLPQRRNIADVARDLGEHAPDQYDDQPGDDDDGLPF
jgi:hypothetical protein